MNKCICGSLQKYAHHPKCPEFRLYSQDHPSDEGKRRYPDPPVGHYNANTDPGPVCTCKPGCTPSCTGTCGCEACRESYGDFLSSE